MSETQYARIITKASTGTATIPPSADHSNGDWISTDIYEHELYIDDATGDLYTNIGGVITKLNPSSPDTNFANTNLTLTGNRTHALGSNSVEFSGGFIGMNTTPNSTMQLAIDAGAKPYAIYATGPTIAVLGSGDIGISGTGSTFGVRGTSSGTQGVRGETTTGAGVAGASSGSGVGVLGSSSTGVAGDFKGGLFVEGSGGSGSINASAIIQADSTTRGALLPRMTTAQRDAIATPATGLEIYNTTTSRKEFYNGSYWRGDTVDIQLQANQSSPTASTTTYFGYLAAQPTATSQNRRMLIRKDGVIRFAEIYSRANTAGDNTNWSLYVRLNDTTDYLIQTVGVSANERIWTNSSLNIPVIAGDYVEIKMVNPAWGTAPANITFAGRLTIE